MNILITGASGGIGSAVAGRFLKNGHTVCGLDVAPAPFDHPGYTHFVADIREANFSSIINKSHIIPKPKPESSGIKNCRNKTIVYFTTNNQELKN